MENFKCMIKFKDKNGKEYLSMASITLPWRKETPDPESQLIEVTTINEMIELDLQVSDFNVIQDYAEYVRMVDLRG